MAVSPALPGLAPSPWELAAETIAVKIRWFGLLIGVVLVNIAHHPPQRQLILNAILALGLAYTLLDTWFSYRDRVFLGRYPPTTLGPKCSEDLHGPK